MDLRVSAKDLIKNHLTMALYNHAAIWEDSGNDMMPKSYFTNGMVVVDGQKMSKSTGNFLMLEESCAGDYYDQKTLNDKNPRPLSWCADAGEFRFVDICLI
jgi:cysteinyl-tRNA synthetase